VAWELPEMIVLTDLRQGMQSSKLSGLFGSRGWLGGSGVVEFELLLEELLGLVSFDAEELFGFGG